MAVALRLYRAVLYLYSGLFGDDFKRRLESLHRVQIAGIQRHCILCRLKRRHRPLRVSAVAFRHLFQNARVYTVLAPIDQLPMAPFGADIGSCGDKNLHMRRRADHGPDVAAIQYNAFGAIRRLLCKTALEGQQAFAQGRPGRDAGSQLAAAFRTQAGSLEVCEGEIRQCRVGKML